MKPLISIVIVLLWAPAYGETPQWSPDPCQFMDEANEPCHYKVGDKIFTVNASGNITYGYDGKPITLVIKLPEYFSIERVRFGEVVENSVAFNFEITDHESGGSVIALVNLSNGIIKWQRDIPAFNSSPLLIINGAVYVGGIGYIAKLNLADGSIAWFHDGLYEHDTQAYNSFDKPFIKGENVVFPESKSPTAKYSGIRSVVVRLNDGSIVSR